MQPTKAQKSGKDTIVYGTHSYLFPSEAERDEAFADFAAVDAMPQKGTLDFAKLQAELNLERKYVAQLIATEKPLL